MKIHFEALSPVPDDRLRANAQHARALGFPRLGKAGRARLAVVGGGPSILDCLDDIRAFDGDVWAINGAFQCLADRGIQSTFYSIDPLPIVPSLAMSARKAVLATCCDPAIWDCLKDAEVSAFDIGEGGFLAGPTSASTAPLVAVEMGYREVTFYGCESSYATHQTHAYMNRPLRSVLRVECNGESFLTSPDMFMQAEFLSEILRAAPAVFKERSGGLLRAMIADPDWDITAASRSIHDSLKAA